MSSERETLAERSHRRCKDTKANDENSASQFLGIDGRRPLNVNISRFWGTLDGSVSWHG